MGVRHTETSLIIWSKAAPAAGGGSQVQAAPAPSEQITSIFQADMLYDAGDKGCAAGPMDEIAALIRTMSSGQTLEIRATDPSVAFDLGAWCRMTGNSLETQQADRYLVRKA